MCNMWWLERNHMFITITEQLAQRCNSLMCFWALSGFGFTASYTWQKDQFVVGSAVFDLLTIRNYSQPHSLNHNCTTQAVLSVPEEIRDFLRIYDKDHWSYKYSPSDMRLGFDLKDLIHQSVFLLRVRWDNWCLSPCLENMKLEPAAC